MGRVEKSDWQRRYDKSIKEEKARNAESDDNESAWWHLFDGLPSTGTGLDLVFAPIGVSGATVRYCTTIVPLTRRNPTLGRRDVTARTKRCAAASEKRPSRDRREHGGLLTRRTPD